MNTKAFDILKERGYVYQSTDEESIKEILNNKKAVFYLGIDPTADSLHIGHFFALTMVRRLQKLGHKAIIVIGGATALIGDPSGKTELRKVITKDQVNHNKAEVKKLVEQFVDITGDNAAIVLDNNEWFSKETYIDFMREIGIHFNVNKMLSSDLYAKRLENGGLTFLEMGYMLMQAYDFVHLNKMYDCVLQIGGSDQWGNIVAGVELFRKLNFVNGTQGNSIYGLTCPLLVKADGEKMGKTASGTLWVSREKTAVYDFYQMFVNSYDEDVERLLSFFSDFDMSAIKTMCKEDIVNAKKVMAYEVTKLVHGQEEALKVKQASEDMFSKGMVSENIPTHTLDKQEVKNGINILDVLVQSGLASSKSEARRLIDQGGVLYDNEKISDTNFAINKTNFSGEAVLQKGKKSHIRLVS